MGDLTYDTIIFVSDTIPINIGFIASYAKKIHGNDINISLYKFPQTILDAIEKDPPDIVALSNYSWNSNLAEMVAGFAKKHNPNVITVQGGTNFPHLKELQKDFLLQRPNTDFFVELEGENSFSELVRCVLEARDGTNNIHEQGIPGCVNIVPSTRFTNEPVLLKGDMPKRIKLLDEIPSPYLNGMLDRFFDGRLTPFLETNRGCPFKCSFCHTGNDYYNKMNMFSVDRIAAEIEYLGPKMQELGIVNLHIADTNFGMIPRDKIICEMIAKSREKYGWPLYAMATTGKNSKDRIIEATQILGNTFRVNMSVQSMDSNVLKNINRDNIKLDHYTAVNQILNERGRSSAGEVILGLPGETRESFLLGIKKILDAGVSMICSYSLMLLHGTKFKEPDYREKFKIKGKYRIVPLNFGEYKGEKVFDVEETGIATKDLSFDDYLFLRGFSLIIEIIHNSRPFHELFKFANTQGISIYDFVWQVYSNIEFAPEKVQEIVQSFINETEGELWDSEEELVSYYKKEENYQKLLNGEIGGNVIYKHKAISLSYCSGEWVDYLKQICIVIVHEKEKDPELLEKAQEELKQISDFVKNRLHGVLQVEADTSPREMESNYDIVAWRKSKLGAPLSDYALSSPIMYEFVYTKDQLRTRQDQFSRWGTDINACSKIITRGVSVVEALFREVLVHGNLSLENQETEQFVRYALSN